MNEKNSSRFVIIFMGSLLAVSALLTWIMIKNYSKDTSKERSILTRAHKEASKKEFVYNKERATQVYGQFCMRCHGSNGQGSMSAPPLAGSPLLNAEKSVPVRIVTHGMKGKIERDGQAYDLIMPGFPMINNEDLAYVLTFARKSFGNDSSEITTVEVIEAKVKYVERNKPWTEEELLK